MAQILLEGLGLGLATGIYCLTACAPFFVPYLISENRGKWSSNFRLVAEFLIGRLLAYVLFAAAVSFIGMKFKNSIPPKLLSGAVILTALLMILYGLPVNFPRFELCIKIQKYSSRLRFPLLLGFLVGINICPPFVQGLLTLLFLGSVLKGILFFTAFYLATTIYTLPLLSIGILHYSEKFKNIGTVSSLISGIWFFIAGTLHFFQWM